MRTIMLVLFLILFLHRPGFADRPYYLYVTTADNGQSLNLPGGSVMINHSKKIEPFAPREALTE